MVGYDTPAMPPALGTTRDRTASYTVKTGLACGAVWGASGTQHARCGSRDWPHCGHQHGAPVAFSVGRVTRVPRAPTTRTDLPPAVSSGDARASPPQTLCARPHSRFASKVEEQITRAPPAAAAPGPSAQLQMQERPTPQEHATAHPRSNVMHLHPPPLPCDHLTRPPPLPM